MRLIYTTLLLVPLLTGAAHPAPFTGKFTNGFDRYPNVSLTLLQTGSRVRGTVTILGDSSGTRVVTSEFEGRINRGVAYFNWTDSYENAGSATFRPDGKAWRLGSRITRPANDGRYFEGVFKLTRVSTRVSEDDLPRPAAP
jgi:hypothetical protein